MTSRVLESNIVLLATTGHLSNYTKTTPLETDGAQEGHSTNDMAGWKRISVQNPLFEMVAHTRLVRLCSSVLLEPDGP